MKTLELSLIVTLCFFGFAVAQNNCPGPDYSVLLKLLGSLNATVKPVKAVGYPEQLPLNNSRYANFWDWNYIGQEYADTINNITSFIFQGYSLFSSAVNNTKGDWNTLIANISQMIEAINATAGSLSIPMSYAGELFMSFGFDIQQVFSNFQNMLGSYSAMIPLLNINATPANVLKFLPSSMIMASVLNQIANITNRYIALINSTSKDINNTYSLFKQADPYFLAIETQYNTTVNNMSLATNKSMIFMNQTIFNFTKSAITLYNTFMNALPTALKTSTAWQDDWTTANASRDAIIDVLTNFAANLTSNLLDYFTNNKMVLYTFYMGTIMGQTDYIRNLLFQLFTMNVTYNQCYSKFLNQSIALFNASGGAAALFNCTILESTVLPELQLILTTYINTISIDVNGSLALLQKCLNLTNTPILANGASSTGYSMQQCLESIGGALLQSFGSYTTEKIEELIIAELTMSTDSLDACMGENADIIMGTFSPLFEAYTNCTTALAP